MDAAQARMRGFLVAWWMGHPMAGTRGRTSWQRLMSYGADFVEVDGVAAVDVDRAPWNVLDKVLTEIPGFRMVGMQGWRLALRHGPTGATLLGPEVELWHGPLDPAEYASPVSRREDEVAAWWEGRPDDDVAILGRLLPALTVDTGRDDHGRIPVVEGRSEVRVTDRGWELFLAQDPVGPLVDAAQAAGMRVVEEDRDVGHAVLTDGASQIELSGSKRG